MLLAYISLVKPRIVALVVFVALASAIVAGGDNFLLSRVVFLVVAMGLASAGASLLNNYLDRDIDAIMERTRNRPLPSKTVAPYKVFLAGIILITVSVPIALRLNYLVALFLLSGALIYVVIYTLWLKRRSPLNIVIGGLAGSCAILAGWFAITTEISLSPILLAVLVFLWTPSHFWSLALAHQESYKKANIPMLPVVVGVKRTADYILLSSVLLLLVALLIYFLGPFHKVYLLGSLLLGGLFLVSNMRLWKQPTRERAWINFKLSGIYLSGLFLVMFLDVLL